MTMTLAWSGGKDSALALLDLRRRGIEPAALLTTITEGYERVSMHGVRRDLLGAQAEAAGIPLVEVRIPPGCVNAVYDARMGAAVSSLKEAGIKSIAFGDIYLEDVRAYREERLARAGIEAVFPLWGRDTAGLARAFVAAFEAVVVCLDPGRLDATLAGRPFDEALLSELPPDVDPCGENGEFHTFVVDGPVLCRRVQCATGPTVEREGFVFADLLPT
jgi:uncharacterized protein (TIGR00290 family)